MTTKYLAARGFNHDPSEIVTDVQCPREWWRPINRSLALFPRTAFDFVWLINPPPYDPKYTADLTLIWSDPNGSKLFRVNHVDVVPKSDKTDFPVPPKSPVPLF